MQDNTINTIANEIFKKIVELPVETEFKMGEFFKDYEIDNNSKFKVHEKVLNLCEENQVKIINLLPDAVLGMPWVFPYKKLTKNLDADKLSQLTKDDLPPVSKNDMKRIYGLIEERKKQDYEFYEEELKNINIYIFPLESNTNLMSLTCIANKMVSLLHYCFEAKSKLNLISDEFIRGETHTKFMIDFTDGFMFDELEKFSSYSEEKLRYHSEDNYYAYFFAYILGLIDKLPENPESCDEKQLCSLITKFNSFGELLDNCRLLSKEQVLYIADYLSLEYAYYTYKKHKDLPYDEKMEKYIQIQMNCSYYVLSYDHESMMEKLKKIPYKN